MTGDPGRRRAACTVVTRNHLAHARVLAESFLEHNPGWRFAVLIVDDPEERVGAGEPFDVLRPQDVGVDRARHLRAAMMYGAQGRASSMKATLLRSLIDAGAPAALLFDADIRVYAPLEPVAELAEAHGLVLSPHVHDPVAPGPVVDFERMLLASGVFNGGFVACGAGGRGFLDWWDARSRSGSRDDDSARQFFSQNWLTLAPSFFDHHVLRDRGCNVMGWNVLDRDVAWTGDRPTVDGGPLRFFHFAGRFDPDHPGRLSSDPVVAAAWPDLADRPGIARLCRDYAGALIAHGHRDVRDLPGRFTALGDGTPIDDVMRVAYRRAAAARDRGGATGDWPPNPLDGATPEAFIAWLMAPPDGGAPDGVAVSRYLLAYRERRPDLVAAFPDVPGPDSAAYLDWAGIEGDGPSPPFRPARAC